MKKTLIITFLITVSMHSFPQEETNFFNEATGVTSIPFYSPPPEFLGGTIYFALTKINSPDNLDVFVTNNSKRGHFEPPWPCSRVYENFLRKGSWNLNNGNGGFGTLNGFYVDETYGPGQDINYIYGCVAVRLRDNDYREDIVVGRIIEQSPHNGIWVTWNDGSIGGVQQTINNVNVSQIEKGRFFNFHSREDVIVRDGNAIRIFNNQGNGYLNPTSIDFSPQQTTFGKFKIKQMNSKALEEGYWWVNPDDREDLIVIDNFGVPGNQPRLKVFLNSNNNTFNNATTGWIINIDYNTTELEVADVDHDGYNDIIVNSPSSGTRIYKNVNGQSISSTPIWADNYIGFTYTPIAGDVNKDGWNDLVLVGFERVTKLFLNTKTSPIYNQNPDETHGTGNWGEHRTNIRQTALDDIYSTGGLALIVSGSMDHEMPQPDCPMISNTLKVLNATNYNPAPAALVVDQDLYLDGSLWRPVVLISNKREKDWLKWAVYKQSPSTNNQEVFLAFTQQTYFTDYTEYVIIGGDEPPVPNCHYFVKQVDESMQYSDRSNNVYFTVGTPICGTCGDNPNSIYNVEMPREFKVTNFPNPFNPVTKISYLVPKDSRVKITVYNTLGQSIREVVNSFKKKGAYMHEFDGSNLPSGIYFYRFEADSFTKVNKMVLIK